MNRVLRAFRLMHAWAGTVAPELECVGIHGCRLADREHALSDRQYMHVFHHPGKICYARAVVALPDENLWGLIAHEFGHLLVQGPGEERADQAAARVLGWPVRYDARTLEWLSDPWPRM